MTDKYTLHTFSYNTHLVDKNDMDEETVLGAVLALKHEWEREEDVDFSPPDDEKLYLKEELGKGAILIMAKDTTTNSIVGYRRLITTLPYPPDIKLFAMESFISPEHRNKGIFRAILQRSTHAAVEAGHEFLYTSPIDELESTLIAEGYTNTATELDRHDPKWGLYKIDLRPFREGNPPGENGLPPQARK